MRSRIALPVFCLSCLLVCGAWTPQFVFGQDAAGPVEAAPSPKEAPPKTAKPADKTNDQPAAEKEERAPDYTFLYMIGGMGLLFYFIILKPQRRDRRKRDEALNQLKKHDRVVTIGGIIGTVVSVDSERDEVVLELDRETRVRFLRRSIQGPTAPSESGEPEKSKNEDGGS